MTAGGSRCLQGKIHVIVFGEIQCARCLWDTFERIVPKETAVRLGRHRTFPAANQMIGFCWGGVLAVGALRRMFFLEEHGITSAAIISDWAGDFQPFSSYTTDKSGRPDPKQALQ